MSRDRDADLRRRIRRAGYGDQPGLALHEQVVGFFILVRSAPTVTGDRTVDEGRVAVPQLLSPETEPVRGSGGQVLNEYVGGGEEFFEYVLGGFLFEVEWTGTLWCG